MESIFICEQIMGKENLKARIPIVYILTTDIDTQKNAALVLTQQLNMLANTATKWETVCADKMRTHFQAETRDIKDIKTAFVFCKELDAFIANLVNN